MIPLPEHLSFIPFRVQQKIAHQVHIIQAKVDQVDFAFYVGRIQIGQDIVRQIESHSRNCDDSFEISAIGSSSQVEQGCFFVVVLDARLRKTLQLVVLGYVDVHLAQNGAAHRVPVPHGVLEQVFSGLNFGVHTGRPRFFTRLLSERHTVVLVGDGGRSTFGNETGASVITNRAVAETAGTNEKRTWRSKR